MNVMTLAVKKKMRNCENEKLCVLKLNLKRGVLKLKENSD